VRQQFADGDGIDGAVGIVDLAQFGHVTNRRIVERQPAAVAQLQNGDGGKGLGDGCPVVTRFCIHRLVSRNVGFALEELRCRTRAMNERESTASNSVPAQLCVET